MAKGKFVFKPDNFEKLMEMVRPDVGEAGEKARDAIAAQLPGDVPVTSTLTTGDNGRPVALVTIAHASGLPRQAKDGVVTRGAATVGLEVTRYEER